MEFSHSRPVIRSLHPLRLISQIRDLFSRRRSRIGFVMATSREANEAELSGSIQAALFLPPYYTFGNAGINYLVGPGTENLDFAVLKTFPLFETHSLEFRAEFFNALNFVNFNIPNAIVGTPSYGVITGAGPSREIQFALKFNL